MNNQPTPETDALVPQFLKGGEVPDVFAHCRKLERERDEARYFFEEQSEVVRNLKVALMETSKLTRTLKEERDEAREELDEEKKFHHRTHAELIQTQCKLLDIEMQRDELKEQLGQAMEIAEDFCGLVCYGMGTRPEDWSIENTRDARRTINWFHRLQEAVTK